MTDLLRTISSLFTRELPGKRELLAQVGSTASGERARTIVGALAIGSKRMELGKVWADIAMLPKRNTTDGEVGDLTAAVIDDIHGSLDHDTVYALNGRMWLLRNEIYDQLRAHATGEREPLTQIQRARAARMRNGDYGRLQKAVTNIIEARIDEAASNMDMRN